MKRLGLSILSLFIIVLITLFISQPKKNKTYIADFCSVSFFYTSNFGNIQAVNTTSKPSITTERGEIQINITNLDFTFPDKQMQEHFNQNYIESSKYPTTSFKGRVNEKIDYTKDAVNNVTVTGVMMMHGVSNTITIPGTMKLEYNIISLLAKFSINPADFNIKLPKLLLENSGTDKVAITLNCTLKAS